MATGYKDLFCKYVNAKILLSVDNGLNSEFLLESMIIYKRKHRRPYIADKSNYNHKLTNDTAEINDTSASKPYQGNNASINLNFVMFSI